MSENAPPPLSDDELAFLESVFGLARDGETGRLVEVIEAGVPVNLTNPRGDSLLILAAYHRRADTVDALLRLGADTGRINDMGQTALGAAVFRNDAGIVRRLLDAGADPGLGGKTAMDIAHHFELTEMQQLLEQASGRGGRSDG